MADGRPAAGGCQPEPEGLGKAVGAFEEPFRDANEQGMVQEQDEGMIARDYRCASRGRLRGGLRMVRKLVAEFVTQAAHSV